MNSLTIKQLTVPLGEYATVSDKSTLLEAILALEEAQAKSAQSGYPHRAILVFDDKNRVVGKLGQLDILMALESKYSEIPDFERLTGIGLSTDFSRELFNQYSIWNEPLEKVCEEAADLKVTDVMYQLGMDEYIEETASLDEAIHQLIMGKHQSLLVTQDERIVGILKLTDVFQQISQMIKTYQPPA
jgi:CBS domain-containing protein